jgi:S1-C subfamily serine protease
MSDHLQQLSNALADTVEAAGASTVRVEARRRLPATGVVWSAEDGLIVTAHHVVRQDEDITVGLPNGERAEATLIGRDPHTDLALLHTQAALTAPKWASLDDLRVGHLVMAVGRPGASPQATLGIVSALGDKWRAPSGGALEAYLQTDVVMYPGFSGGPLVNAMGQTFGINTSALMRGMSITIPTQTIERVAATLREHGRMRQAYLGVSVQPARLPEAIQQRMEQETGLLITTVIDNSPAAESQLAMGDTILRFAGTPTRQMDDLLSALSSDRIGEDITIKVLRGGEPLEMTVTIGEKA